MKTQIINTILPILNEHGLRDISLEQLLKYSGVSHKDFQNFFRDYDQLLVEIFDRFFVEINEVSSRIDQPDIQLAAFYDNCVASFEVQKSYSFIFNDFHYVMKIEELKDRYFEMLRERKAHLAHLFQFFVQAGIFKKEVVSGQFENLNNQILVISGFWPSHSKAVFGEVNVEYYASLIFSLLVPYLSAMGLEAYKDHVIVRKQ